MKNLIVSLICLLIIVEARLMINNRDKSETIDLIEASQNGDKETVQLLTKNATNLNQTNNIGMNALHLASEKGHLEMVRVLIEKGIDINKTDEYDGKNALHFASSEGHKEIVKLLIEKGIDINQKEEDGWNALHFASEFFTLTVPYRTLIFLLARTVSMDHRLPYRTVFYFFPKSASSTVRSVRYYRFLVQKRETYRYILTPFSVYFCSPRTAP